MRSKILKGLRKSFSVVPKGLASLVASLPVLIAIGAGNVFGFNRAIMEGIHATNNAIYVTTGSTPASSSVTVQNLIIQQLTPNQLIQTNGTDQLITTGLTSGSFIGNQTIFQPGSAFNVSTGTVSSMTVTALSGQTGVFSGALTGASFVDTGLPPNQCVQTNGVSQLTTSGLPCGSGSGGGGGGTPLQVSVNNVTVTTPTPNINFSSAFTGSLVAAATAFIDLNYSSATAQGNTFNAAGQLLKLNGSGVVPTANLPPVIFNQATLQSGATFYVSSGTMNTGNVTSNFYIPDGLQVAPSLAFTNEPGSGLYRSGATTWWLTVTGSQILELGPTFIYPNSPLIANNGSPSAPSYTFNNDATSGLYLIGSKDLGFSTGKIKALELKPDQTVAVTYGVTASSVSASSMTVSSLTISNIASGIQCLQANASGLVTGTGSGCSTGGTPGGSATQWQYDNNGVFGGISNSSVFASSVALNEPLSVQTIYDTNLSASLPVLTDANKQLISGNIPLADVSGTLAVGNGGTGLGSATNNAVILGNGSAWTAAVIPSCSGSGNGLNFNTGTNAVGCASFVTGAAGSNYNVQFSSSGVFTGASFLNVFVSSLTDSGSGGLGVTYGVTMGSLTINSSGAGAQQMTEGADSSVFTSASGKDNFWASASSHSLVTNYNGSSSTGTLVTSTGTSVPGDFASWSGQGSLVDNGSLFAANNTWTGQNNWTSIGQSTFSFGVTAGSITLQTNNQNGGNIYFRNSGNQNAQMSFLTDTGGTMGFINYLNGTYFRIETDDGAILSLRTGATDRLRIENSGNIGINQPGASNSQLGVTGSASNIYTAIFSTGVPGAFTVSITTSNHLNFGGSQPVAGTCGSSPQMLANSSDLAGSITWAGASSSCAFTFAKAFINPPFCLANTNGAAFTEPFGVTATSATFAFSASLTGSTMTWHCFGGSGN